MVFGNHLVNVGLHSAALGIKRVIATHWFNELLGRIQITGIFNEDGELLQDQ